MKVTFPHMGNTYIAIAGALKVLGAEFIIPPYNTKKTLNIGSKHSPEAVCLPYKLVLGNYLEAIEQGAEAILMINSKGICRLGEYSECNENVIKDLGYNVEFLNLDLYKGKTFEIYQTFSKFSKNSNPVSLIKAVHILLTKIDLIDQIDDVYSYYRAREIKRGNSKKVYKKALKLLDDAMTAEECKKALEKGVELFKKVPVNVNKDVLNIDLTGEIYVAIDQFSNMDVEDELGKMGVHVHRRIKLSNWSKNHLKPSLFDFSENHEDKVKRLASEFLKRDVGGDALESIGDTVEAGNKKSDGVVHLLPFTCMPEIISQNILHNITREKDIPVMSLVLDEFTGKAGFITRLEAFVDLAKRRKKKRGQTKILV